MEHPVNGTYDSTAVPSTSSFQASDIHVPGTEEDPSQEDLERELPVVFDGQVPLGELLSRVVQSIYAELTEMAET